VDRLQEDNIVDPPKDNIGGQRSKFDVMAAILHICQEGSLKNHIIGKGNFSDAMANHYLSILLYHNLLESSRDENGRVYYKTTGKGRQFIGHYANIQGLFSRLEAAAQENDRQMPRLSSETIDRQTSSKRILVVDDESDISSAIKIGLEDNGFAVNVFNDPLSALSSYRPGAYDLLILDVKMPKMNGFELYREIRKADSKAKVCFLTAFEMYGEEFRRVFPSMDVKHFIQKPISMSDLVDQIRKLTDQD
jgi:CheY-like chemotaxis protein/predicted transcriptional regulator